MSQQKQSVLVVEDDPALRRLVEGYLTLMGLEVVGAPDGKSAVAKLSAQPFDLVCLDLMLPESSGYDVCEYMRQQPSLAGIPIVMMSARTLPEDRAHAEEVGATAFIIKPFSRSEFTRQIRAVLTNHPLKAGSA